MKYTFKDAMRMFDCTKKDIVCALRKYGYYSKKAVIDDKCIDYLGNYFANKEFNFDLNSCNNSRSLSLEKMMQDEFNKDCRRVLNSLENDTLENFYIDNLKSKAMQLNLLEDNIFDFLRDYYPDLYRAAQDAVTAYKTIGYIEHYSRYCLNDIGLFLELFVTYLLNRNGLVESCKSTYSCDNINLYSKIRFLSNHGLPKKIVDLLDITRLIRNKIHVLLENNSHQYVPDSLNYSFQQDITEEDCREYLENVYVLSCWLVRKDNFLENEKKN